MRRAGRAPDSLARTIAAPWRPQKACPLRLGTPSRSVGELACSVARRACGVSGREAPNERPSAAAGTGYRTRTPHRSARKNRSLCVASLSPSSSFSSFLCAPVPKPAFCPLVLFPLRVLPHCFSHFLYLPFFPLLLISSAPGPGSCTFPRPHFAARSFSFTLSGFSLFAWLRPLSSFVSSGSGLPGRLGDPLPLSGDTGEGWWYPGCAPRYWLHWRHPQRFESEGGTVRAEGRAGTLP